MTIPARRATDIAPHDHLDTADTADTDMHALCEAWADWCRAGNTPGFAAAAEPPRRRSTDQAAPSVAAILALHLAVVSQPANALDRLVFEIHYLHGARHIKAEAARLGISRPHWYRLVADFRRRIQASLTHIERQNSAWKNLGDETSFRLTNRETPSFAPAF